MDDDGKMMNPADKRAVLQMWQPPPLWFENQKENSLSNIFVAKHHPSSYNSSRRYVILDQSSDNLCSFVYFAQVMWTSI